MGRVLLPVILASLAGSAMAQAPDWRTAPRVPVDLNSFRFDPATITMEHGRPYILRLTNNSGGGHDFAAKSFFAAARIADEEPGVIRNGKVELDGGRSVDIRLIAPAPGRYEVHCSHFLHTTFGMKGVILVR